MFNVTASTACPMHYLMEELARLGDPAAAKGRVILAHLGNGASLAAVRDGKSIDTSMGFTPAAGLVMSTRSGDLDPGLVSYLARTERMTAAQFQQMVNHESGLLGVSEISSDMRDLLAREADDVRAAEAVALFCYQAKKWIGSFAAALGGLDTLVFAGGIGENAPLVRERICEGLGFLGIELNEARNTENAPVISTDAGRVTVRVIRTDEELMIARSVLRVLGLWRTERKVEPMKPKTSAKTLDPESTAQDGCLLARRKLPSVGQIYLYDNPLLKKPLTLAHIKPRLLGHWGTTPGLNFIYVHLNRVIKEHDLNVIYITGPGHGGPGTGGERLPGRNLQRSLSRTSRRTKTG